MYVLFLDGQRSRLGTISMSRMSQRFLVGSEAFGFTITHIQDFRTHRKWGL